MLTKDQVIQIIDELKKSKFCYVSEAHIQLQFAIIGAHILGDQFDFIPEFPGHTTYHTNIEQKTEFDLLVLDKNTEEKTLIEFKYKTKNETQKNKQRMQYPIIFGGALALANHGAQNLNRYDCWRDIYRIEQNVIESKKPNNKSKVQVSNGFFIFVTNDPLYENEDGTTSFCYQNTKGMFSLKKGSHDAQLKRVNPSLSVKTAGAFRLNNDIDIQNDYTFCYQPFQMFNVSKYNEFRYLLVEIK